MADDPARRRHVPPRDAHSPGRDAAPDPCELPAGHTMTAEELCFGITIGPRLMEYRVAATTDAPVRLEIPADGCPHLLLTRGAFRYSSTGVQDALRRWHEPGEDNDPACVSCELTEDEARVSFTIDGLARRPLLECPFQSTYIHGVPDDARVVDVAIHDATLSGQDPYADNSGELLVSVHRLSRSSPIVTRDAVGVRLGSPVGEWVGGHWAGIEPLGDELTALLVAAKLLQVNPFDVITFTAPQVMVSARDTDEFLVEVSGIAGLGAGFELDAEHIWDHTTRGVGGSSCASRRLRGVSTGRPDRGYLRPPLPLPGDRVRIGSHCESHAA
jgi:hypothetical protein